MPAPQLLALQLPQLPPGKIFPIPDLPPGMSPAALVLMAGLITGAVLAGLGDETPRARKPHKDEAGRDLPDNTKVLKVFDAVEVIESVLIHDKDTQALLAKLILKALIAIFKVGHGVWHNAADAIVESQEVREEVWGELATKIENRLREKVLQQSNARFRGVWVEGGLKKTQTPERTIYSQEVWRGDLKPFTIRQGKLHGSDKRNFDL
jgi:hypothetical protein